MSDLDARLIECGRERFDDIVEILATAFRDYPVMRFILKDAGESYELHLRSLVAYYADKRVAQGWPVLALDRDGTLLGVAVVNPPGPAPQLPRSVEERRDRLTALVGHAAMARNQAFATACDPLVPTEPHHHLGMLAVRPDEQGEGYGRLLLEAVQRSAAEDEHSAGVSLSTETSRNVRLYEHFGYRVIGEADVEDVHSWALYRTP